MQDSPTYVGASLVHCSKYCARLNGLSCCYIDRSYGSVLRCYDIILHLHSLKNNDYLTLLYSVTSVCLNTKNLTWHWSADLYSTLCASRCCCMW